jgi:predicted CXXCH cytochrome family protein
MTLAMAFAAPIVQAAPGDPGTGLPSTSHDFSGQAVSGETTGTCTFCHTPHQAGSQSLLWNRADSANVDFTWTNLVTTGGTNYATITTATHTGPTVKCLSCHDTSVAIGDIGWFNAQDPADLGLPAVGAAFEVGVGGDLDGNHPVGMPFPFGAVVNTYNGQTNGASAAASEWQADPEGLGIRLYNDSAGDGTAISVGSAAATTGVECSSCHDPHNGADVQGSFFLRGLIGGNTADYICVKCHNK